MKLILSITIIFICWGCGLNKNTVTRKEYEELIAMDSINGVYIPKDMEDAFTSLNTLLNEEDIEYIQSLENREETIRMHHGLGTWLRNNWGLWGGSRMQKYMLDRGFRHPDGMSAILEYYYDWLKGDNEGWKQFHESIIENTTTQ